MVAAADLHITTGAMAKQVLWVLVATCAWALFGGCSSTPPNPPGPDELVGQPSTSADGEDEAQSSGTFWLHLHPHTDHLQVRIRLLSPPEQTAFFLPTSWAGIDDLDQSIDLLEARTERGPLAMSVDRSRGRVDLSPGRAEWVELHYRVDVADSPAVGPFHPWRSDDAFFAFGPTFLILPPAPISRALRDIPIEVHVPDDWQVASTWTAANDHFDIPPPPGGTFIADDLKALRDAFIGAGHTWEHHLLELGERRAHWTFAGDFDFSPPELMDDVQPLLVSYLERFGHYDELSALIKPRANDDHPGLRGTGRHGGFVLHLASHTPLDDELRILMAHEALHMWNGHLIVPDADARDDVQWFKEGVTHYIAIKTLTRLGLIDESSLRRELASAAHFYLTNPLNVGGPSRPIDHTRLPYDRGLLIAADLDYALWSASDGNLHIEDWLHALLTEPFQRDARRYDEGLLQESFAWLADDYPDVRRRYRELVNHPLNIDAIFHQFGLHFLEARHDRSARLSPLDGGSSAYRSIFGLSSNSESP